MDKQEQAFFDWFSKIEAIATTHGVEISQVVNLRQAFDFGYTAGKMDGITESVEALNV